MAHQKFEIDDGFGGVAKVSFPDEALVCVTSRGGVDLDKNKWLLLRPGDIKEGDKICPVDGLPYSSLVTKKV